jgi:hypothetical protein
VLFALSLAWTLRRARRRPQAGAGDGQGKRPSSDETENGGLRDTRVADTPKITFADVAGCDEAVEELREIAEFSRDPERFRRVGAKLPTGILPYRPPGTGKTPLAPGEERRIAVYEAGQVICAEVCETHEKSNRVTMTRRNGWLTLSCSSRASAAWTSSPRSATSRPPARQPARLSDQPPSPHPVASPTPPRRSRSAATKATGRAAFAALRAYQQRRDQATDAPVSLPKVL